MTTTEEPSFTAADPTAHNASGRWWSILFFAIALSVPIASLLIGEGMIWPTVPLALGLAVLWLIGVYRWWRSTGTGWQRMIHPLPIAFIMVIALGLFVRLTEVPFELSEGALETRALAVLAERAADESSESTKFDRWTCYNDDLERHGLVLATLSCGPIDQVVFKTSVRPKSVSRGDEGFRRASQVSGFVYVAEPRSDEPRVFGWPCRYERLSENFYRYRCEMAPPSGD